MPTLLYFLHLSIQSFAGIYYASCLQSSWRPVLVVLLEIVFWGQLWWWSFSSSDSCNDGVGRCLLKTDIQLKVRQTLKRATFCKGLLSYIAYMAKPKYVIKVSLFSHSKKWDCFSNGKLQNCFIYFIVAYMKLLQDFLQF